MIGVTEMLYLLWSLGTGVLAFGALALLTPQLAGFLANRALSRWVAVSRFVGAVVPLVVVLWVWTDLADRDLERQRAAGKTPICGTGIMSGYVLLHP